MAELGMLDMMKQARNLQKEMGRMQERAEKQRATADAGGGMVTVTVNGRMQLLELKIEDSLAGSGDARMMEDLVLAAVNEALRKVQAALAEEMEKVTGGLNIPGLNIPGLKG